ncbi:MAG: MFS transporter [Chloroflexi bacterium]|nr:MFS transporter [Chloroflexota bacterium]
MAAFPASCSWGPVDGRAVRLYSKNWILLATILGSSMAFIDGTAVNVALPIMQRELGATFTQLQWVVVAYALFLGSLLLVGGSLGDRFGRRRVFVVGIVVFAVASVWAGFSPDVGQLIAARALQGIGGALFVPGSLALIGACFTDAERGKAIGTWSGASGLMAAAGPLLGGFLAEELSWRWVFFINIPIAVIVVVVALTRVPESGNPAAGRVDWLGGLLATVGLGGLVYGLIESGNRGFSDPVVVASLVVGVGALAAFIYAESRVHSPMMPLGIFRQRSFAGANVLTLFLYAGLGGALFFLPLNLVLVQGYSATAAGAALLPLIIIIGVLSRYMGGLVVRTGAKLPLVIGPAVAGVGFLLFAVPGVGGSYWTTYFPAVVAFGLGMSITVAPLVTVVMSTVDQNLSGLASGINNAISRVASLMALAVFGMIALALFSGALDDRLADAGVPQAVVEQLEDERVNLAGAQAPAGLAPDVTAAVEDAIDWAFVDAFRGIMLIGALLAFASSLTALVSIERRLAPRPQPSETA